MGMRAGEIGYARAGEHHIAFREYVGDAGGDHEIVMVSGGFWPMESFTDDAITNRLLEGLAGLGRLILFDRRGIALSDPITDWETPLREQWADDLAAVIEAAGCERPTVCSWSNVAVARTCSVLYPGLIGRLVLFNPSTPTTRADAGWVREWSAGIDRLMDGDHAQPGDRLLPRRGVDPVFRAWNDAAGRAGASPTLARRIHAKRMSDPPLDDGLVDTPTLVITRSPHDVVVPAEYFRRGARAIPGAELVDLGEGDALLVGYGIDDILLAITEYLTGEARLPPPDRRLAAILFTDLVDSTRRAAAVGDAEWKHILDRHDAVIRAQVARSVGEVVKSTGDGVLALFPSASAAVEAALRICEQLGSEGLEVRIGIHVGEVDHRGDDVSGLDLHIAARVMSTAGAGQILATRAVAELARTHVFHSIGYHTLRGVDATSELFTIEAELQR